MLTDVLKAGVARLREQHEPDEEFSREEVEEELARGIERILEAGGHEAEGLRSEIAVVLEEVGAVGAAVEAAIRSRNEVLLERLTFGLVEVGREFTEFGFVLAAVQAQLVQLRAGLDEQNGQMRLTLDLLYRQATQIRMLSKQVSRINAPADAETLDAAPGRTWNGCPYRGLAPFGEDDREVFYGRERVTAKLLTALSQRLTAPGLVVVTGASGAGKSSLLSAGLLPAIGRGELHESASEWPRHLIGAPTGRPLERLASVLAPMAGLDAPTVHAGLLAEPDRAHLMVRQAVERDAQRRGLPAAAAGECRLVLVVDQFEELFTAPVDRGEQTGDDGGDTGEAAAFISALHAAATLPCGPYGTPAALVVIAVRGDFLDHCAAHAVLAEALQDGQFVLGPMTESELRLTVTGPAAAAGLELEAGLIDTIMADLAASAGTAGPGSLPLVSQTMRTVWEHKDGDRLTLRGYSKTGGIINAVATSADAAYTSLPAPARALARRLLTHLIIVTPAGRLARRTASLTEARRAAGSAAPAALDQVLETLAGSRLVTIDDNAIQISHDVLLEAWPRLRGWLQPDLDSHALRAQLLQDADEWDRKGRPTSYLYRGQRLAAVEGARAHWDDSLGRFPHLTSTPRAFLEASRAAQTRGTRIWRAAVSGLSVLLAVTLATALLAFRAQHSADHQRDAAIARQLIAQSQLLLTTDPALASLLAVTAWRIRQGPETRANLLDVLGQRHNFVLPRPARAMAFSSDGQTLVTGDSDRTVRLWNPATRQQIGAPFTGLAQAAGAVALSPDGRTLAAGGYDRTVRLWDVATHRQIGAPLTGHTDGVNSVVFSPDGRILATGSDDKTVRLWDVATRRQIGAPLTGHTNGVNSVVFSPDGRTLATGGSDRVRLWNVATHQQTGAPLTGSARAVAFSPDGRTLATGSTDATGRLWDVATHRQIRKPFIGHPNGVTAVAFSPDGRTLATGGYDDTVRFWEVANHQQIGAPLTGPVGFIRSMAFSPDGRTLATRSHDNQVRLWEVAPHRQIGAPIRDSLGPVAFSPDGRTLATRGVSGSDGERLWDVATHRQVGTLSTSSPLSVAFNPDGRTFATGSSDKVRLWDMVTRQQISAFPTDLPPEVAFTPDGRTLATATLGLAPLGVIGAVRLWDVTHHRQIGAFAIGAVLSLAFSPDGRILATGGYDNTVRLWDVTTHKQIGAPLANPTNSIYAVGFSPDGRTLAASNGDTVRLWDTATREQIGAPLTGHTGIVLSVAFSPDGRTIATGGYDNTVRLWDVTTHKQIGAPLTGHTEYVKGMAFSPDSRFLATGSADNTVRLWDVAMPTDLVVEACKIARRSLTREEWALYVPRGPRYRKVCL
ncbi:WD40 repeat domain-containing protein [Spirillospora sp. NPDC049652]